MGVERTILKLADIDEDDLDEGEEILNRANVLRTFGKVTIIGGSSVTGAVGGPLIAALGSAAGGIILLIDPESQEDIYPLRRSRGRRWTPPEGTH